MQANGISFLYISTHLCCPMLWYFYFYFFFPCSSIPPFLYSNSYVSMSCLFLPLCFASALALSRLFAWVKNETQKIDWKSKLFIKTKAQFFYFLVFFSLKMFNLILIMTKVSFCYSHIKSMLNFSHATNFLLEHTNILTLYFMRKTQKNEEDNNIFLFYPFCRFSFV